MPMGGKQRISFSHKPSEHTFLQDTSGFTPEFNFKNKNKKMQSSAIPTPVPEAARAFSTGLSTAAAKSKQVA